MFLLGQKQTLIVEKTVPMGVFLVENAADRVKQGAQEPGNSPRHRAADAPADRDHTKDEPVQHVLLPRKYVPQGTQTGDAIEVFLYKDSEDRLVATTITPKLMLGEVGYLTVREVGRIGAFLDWGLEKDLLLPFHEQPKTRVQKGQSVLCAVYTDKSDRLCATMNVYPWLRTDSPYHAGDEVQGTVYETSDNFGTFVAVDDMYSALIPKKELVRKLKIGEKVRGRVTLVRTDGKLNLSIREKAYLQIDADGKLLLEKLKSEGGSLAVTDKSDPQLIRDTLGMSKAQFKRAAGHLYKERLIEITESEITLK